MSPPEWRKTPGGGGGQGVGGGVESPQGINIPGVEEFPQGDKTTRETTEGDGVPVEDGRGKGGVRNPPTPEKPRRAETAAETRGGRVG